MQTSSFRTFLDSWPYDPDHNVRLESGADGRQIVLVSQPLGLEQYEIEGRPDGQRPHGMESFLEFHLAGLAAKERAGPGEAFKLTAEDCAKLFDEGTSYYHRFVSFLRLKDWARAERDTARNMRLVSFVARYAEHEEDRLQLEQWRFDIILMNAIARAMILLGQGQSTEAIRLARQAMEKLEGVEAHSRAGRDLLDALLQKGAMGSDLYY